MFWKTNSTRQRTLPWLTKVMRPRDYRNIQPSSNVIKRLFGDSEENTLFENRNYSRLYGLIKPSAEAGNPKAQYILGWMYDSGCHCPQDDAAAFHWYLQAAVQGLRESEYEVGLMYFSGQGMPENLTEALRWFFPAAMKNHPEALTTVGTFHQFGTGCDVDLEEAVGYYLRATQAGDGGGAFNIALLCQHNDEFELAALWYDVAFRLECRPALGNFNALYHSNLIPRSLYSELGLK